DAVPSRASSATSTTSPPVRTAAYCQARGPPATTSSVAAMAPASRRFMRGLFGQRLAHQKGALLIQRAVDIGVQVFVTDAAQVVHGLLFRSGKEMISAVLDCINSRSLSRARASRDITVPRGISSSSEISR